MKVAILITLDDLRERMQDAITEASEGAEIANSPSAAMETVNAIRRAALETIDRVKAELEAGSPQLAEAVTPEDIREHRNTPPPPTPTTATRGQTFRHGQPEARAPRPKGGGMQDANANALID